MKVTTVRAFYAALLISIYGISGCGQPAAAPSQEGEHHDHPGHVDGDEHSHHEGEHKHGEWWCDEHGVPEAVCAQCDSKLAAEFQKNGDWCKEHNRPDSQCFICHPELQAKFAAQYEAKYGKQPPAPKLDGEAHEHEHDHAEEKAKSS